MPRRTGGVRRRRSTAPLLRRSSKLFRMPLRFARCGFPRADPSRIRLGPQAVLALLPPPEKTQEEQALALAAAQPELAPELQKTPLAKMQEKEQLALELRMVRGGLDSPAPAATAGSCLRALGQRAARHGRLAASSQRRDDAAAAKPGLAVLRQLTCPAVVPLVALPAGGVR